MRRLEHITARWNQRRPSMAGVTDPGKLRDHNEDAFFLSEDRGWMLVCDGMGGHVGGATASRLAVETANEYLHTDRVADMRRCPDTIPDVLERCCMAAHRRMQEAIEADANLAGMGSTFLLAFVEGQTAHLVHVGDSRAYRCAGERFELLTHDHSYVMDMVRAGRLSLEEARVHPDRHWIRQAVGGSPSPRPDYIPCVLAESEVLLLCTDGLWEMLPDERLAALISRTQSLKQLCRDLVAAANDAGGEDNVTVLLYRGRAGRTA